MLQKPDRNDAATGAPHLPWTKKWATMDHMISQHIAAEVRAELARRRLIAGNIAKAAGLTPSQFSRRLHGHIPFSADEVAAIAKAIGVPVSVLYGETEAA